MTRPCLSKSKAVERTKKAREEIQNQPAKQMRCPITLSKLTKGILSRRIEYYYSFVLQYIY
jgi:Txe/YoeB family toxin of Txe-Axe toxin-antitoxin module